MREDAVHRGQNQPLPWGQGEGGIDTKKETRGECGFTAMASTGLLNSEGAYGYEV